MSLVWSQVQWYSTQLHYSQTIDHSTVLFTRAEFNTAVHGTVAVRYKYNVFTTFLSTTIFFERAV